MPDQPEVMGPLALRLLVESRRATRTTPDGDLVLLAGQDRSLWDRSLIAEDQAVVQKCLQRNSAKASGSPLHEKPMPRHPPVGTLDFEGLLKPGIHRAATVVGGLV